MWKTVFNTSLGDIIAVGSEKGLSQLVLPQSTFQNENELNSAERVSRIPAPFTDLPEIFALYLAGKKIVFPYRLDLSSGTAFQQAAWQTARLIPHGETRSYLWLAQAVGKPGAYRAAGQALGKNPLPIIVPCHRVVARSGALVGFSAGLDTKRFLLRLEKDLNTGRP